MWLCSFLSPDCQPIREMLDLKPNDKLAFVDQVVYNSTPATLYSKAEVKHMFSTKEKPLRLHKVSVVSRERAPQCAEQRTGCCSLAPGCLFIGDHHPATRDCVLIFRSRKWCVVLLCSCKDISDPVSLFVCFFNGHGKKEKNHCASRIHLRL